MTLLDSISSGVRPWPEPSTWLRFLRLESREQFRLFPRLFLAVSTVFFVLWQASLYIDARIENDRRLLVTLETARHARDLLGESLKTFVVDLKIIAQTRSLRRLALGDPTARLATNRDFAIFAAEKPVISQLRYLDRSGQEIVRIERDGSRVTAVDRAHLQDKADRPYFRHSIDLPRNGIYISAIDLNIEHGQIAEPWEPTLRLVTPVRAGAGTSGVVVINFSASELIEGIEPRRPTRSAPLQILNHQGYWLAGAPREQLWGFMFGRDTTMAKRNPEVWRRVAADIEGTFESGGIRYAFETLQPASYLEAGRRAGVIRTGDIDWKIVGMIPAVTLADLWKPDRVPVGIAGLLAIAAICLGWSGAIAARREAEARKQRAEGELVRVERLAGLGSLVAGVAHELNTPIGNAVTVASTLSESATKFSTEVDSGRLKRPALESFLEDVQEGTAILLRGLERAADLVRDFKQVAVDQTSEQRRVFQLADLVQNVMGTLQPQFKHSAVTLEVSIDPKITLDGYPGPLSQVLINLVTNACMHGFHEGEAGGISITARALPAKSVEIVVRDTGRGIPEENLQRIFDPFFTTRLGEGGSGLGLSIVFNVVTDLLGGTIRVESRPGAGTAMILTLPRTAPASSDEQSRRTYDVGA